MSPSEMLLIALRLASLGFAEAGRTRTVQAIDAIAILVEAGQNVEDRMAEVKAMIESGAGKTDAAWEDLARRMKEDSDRIQKS